MLFLAILECLNFDFGKFVQIFKAQYDKNSKYKVSNTVKIESFDILIFPKFDST